eukprot:313472-Amphidinium_carterae.2
MFGVEKSLLYVSICFSGVLYKAAQRPLDSALTLEVLVHNTKHVSAEDAGHGHKKNQACVCRMRLTRPVRKEVDVAAQTAKNS